MSKFISRRISLILSESWIKHTTEIAGPEPVIQAAIAPLEINLLEI